MITTFATAQLAAQRHGELIAEATKHRRTRARRAERVPHVRRSDSARRIAAQARSAFRASYAAGQL